MRKLHNTILMDNSGIFILCPKTKKLDRISLKAIKCPQCKAKLPKQLILERS